MAYILRKPAMWSAMTVNFVPAFCNISVPLQRSLAESQHSNFMSVIHSSTLSLRARRPNPLPLWSNPHISDTFSHRARTAPSDLAHIARYSYLRALHDLCMLYRYGPFVRLRLSRNPRTLHSTVPQRRETTLPFLFLVDWALRNSPFSTTFPPPSLREHNNPTRHTAIPVLSPTPRLQSYECLPQRAYFFFTREPV